MKRMTAIIAPILAFALVLSGCGAESGTSKAPAPSTPAQQENTGSQQEPPYVPDDTIPEPWTLDYQSALLDKIPFSVDLGAGWEYRDLSANGVSRRVTVTYEMDSSVIPTDPCYTYFRVDILGEGMYAETVAVGRAFFTDAVTAYVRSEDPDRIDMELFERDFNASAFKGKDKDYVVISVPAGWEQNTATMVIATADGKLLADTEVDKSHQVTLQGDDTGKYMDFSKNTNFFSFSEDSITYLQVFQRVDGVTYLKEYSLTIDNDEITSTETGKTYTTTDTVPDLPGIAVH
ncbi:MAG: hypothetical protein J6Z38_06600 [Lachnospiraceae bacterium]|nr:hypothetical protein [Lachnospiraceae bacterium]